MPAKQLFCLRLRAICLGLVLGLCPAVVRAAPVVIHATAGGPGSAILQFAADELVTMTVYPFQLTIRDAAGHPLTGARVSCELTMPSMPMPENRPAVTERNGTYVGELIFTCPMGDWRFICQTEPPAGTGQTITFDIPRVRMQ